MASHHGTCPRFWYFAFEGNEWVDKHSAYTHRIFQNGHKFHERIQDALMATGKMKAVEIPFFNPEIPLEGHADGILDIDGEEVLYEAKSAKTEGFAFRKLHKVPSKKHRRQVLLYLFALGIRRGIVHYENKNDHEEEFFEVRIDEPGAQELIDGHLEWFKKVHGYFEAKTLPIKPFRKGNHGCAECPFFEVCVSREQGEVEVRADVLRMRELA